MANVVLHIYLSYTQLCIFVSSLAQPFNDWSDRNFTQGFAWRPGSVSFRAMTEDGQHQVNVFVNEPVPPLGDECVRAFRVPFETQDGKIEIASISDGAPLEVLPGRYALQVEFMDIRGDDSPEVNVRFNQGDVNWEILKSDETMDVEKELDLMAQPAN
ncbi:competence protein ComJ [Thiorhodococcus minor]|uniref:Competence protein J (ComJ) n=1 Tax=Thiorhodococcus minor TaxID=57489 RepID=A0A6M0K2B4_9GAMM|nr:competence protein ComJ [Thiorhodococcus minor]NEV63491.1 hypothetical protein [Thiorhodococcus minor]